jgi:hypothetical protein
MTDRFKGFLVTLDKEIREDDAEEIINILKMIKNVHSVKPYVSNLEDQMSYMKAESDIGLKLQNWIAEELFHFKLKIGE